MLVAGSRMGNLDMPFDKYWGDPSGQRLIQIDIDPRNLGVTRPLTPRHRRRRPERARRHRARFGTLGLANRDALRPCALPRARRAGPRGSGHADPRMAGPGIHPAHAIGAIGAVFGADAVYTVDGGNTSLWACSVLPPTRPRSYHSILELGMLGTGIPSAIGAKLGAPDREVVCVTGDGAAGFNIMEMQSAAAGRPAITTDRLRRGLLDDGGAQRAGAYGKTFGTKQGEIRWDIVAQGLGCHGEYVDRIEDLDAALRRAQAHDGPSLVCLRTDHDANFAIPEDMVARFFEVYFGPAEEGVEAEARV